MKHKTVWKKDFTPSVPSAARQTRQQIRAMMRAMAFKEISEQFPGESRDRRRAIAFAKANREFRRLRGLPLESNQERIQREKEEAA